MGAVDPYALTDKLDDSLLQVIVTRLEARAAVRTSTTDRFSARLMGAQT